MGKEDVANENVTIETKEKRSKEEILLDAIASYKFVYTLHFLMDIIPKVGELNLIFQKSDLDLASIHPAIRGVLDTLKKVENGKSFHFLDLKKNV